LIELLVVLVILGIVIAIVLPALAGVRRSAKRAETMNLMSNIKQACEAFKTDARHAPGYFPVGALGAQANAAPDSGFTAMKNIMLDLAGGVTTAAANGTDIVGQVGPSTSTGVTQVNVDLNLIGAPNKNGGGKGYFTPDKRFFVVQTAGEQASASNVKIPD